MLSKNQVSELFAEMQEYLESGTGVTPCIRKFNKAKGRWEGKVSPVDHTLYYKKNPTATDLEQWEKEHGKRVSGFGVYLGLASNLMCIDIDVDDILLLAKMQQSPVVVKGEKGEKRFFRIYDPDSPAMPSVTGTVRVGGKPPKIEFLMGGYAVVCGLHSEPPGQDPLYYEFTRGSIKDLDDDKAGIPVFDPNYIELARKLCGDVSSIGMAQTPGDLPVDTRGHTDGRFRDMETYLSKLIAKRVNPDQLIQSMIDHDDKESPMNPIFMDQNRFQTVNKFANALKFYGDHFYSFAKGKRIEKVELPKVTNSYSKLFKGLEWGDPIPLSMENEVTDMSLDILPNTDFKEWVNLTAQNMGCDVAPIVVQFFTFLSSRLGKKVSIFPKAHDYGWEVYPFLWSLHIAKSGNRKSDITDRVKIFLDKVQEYLDETTKKDRKKNDRKVSRLKHKLKQVQNNIKNAVLAEDKEEDIERLEVIEDGYAQEVAELKGTEKRTMFQIVTGERLIEILFENQDGVLGYYDEFSLLWKTMKKSNYEWLRPFLLSCKDGRGSNYETKTAGKYDLKGGGLSLHANVQPSLLEGMIDETIKENQDDGFLQRSLMTAVTSTEKEQIDITMPVNLQDKMQALFFWANSLSELVVKFEKNAQAKFNDYLEMITKRSQDDSLHPILGSAIAKFPGTIVSVAFILEFIKTHDKRTDLLGTGYPETISLDSLNRAEQILEFNYHALRVQLKRPLYTLGKEVIEMMEKRFVQTDWSATELQKNQPRYFRNVHGGKLLDLLEDHNYIHQEKVGKGNFIRINPQVLGDQVE